jgi:hypothetical protein
MEIAVEESSCRIRKKKVFFQWKKLTLAVTPNSKE